MNDTIYLAACTFVASGAGVFLGRWLERQKALKAFHSLRNTMNEASITSTSMLVTAHVGIIKDSFPDAKTEDIASVLLAAANKLGGHFQVMTRQQVKELTGHDPNSQAE